MIGLGLAGQGHELHILPTGPFDPATADDPASIGEQDDLQQNLGGIGTGTRRVIGVMRIEGREVDLVLQQVVQGMLERARQNLLLEAQRHKGVLAEVRGLVAGHPILPCVNRCFSQSISRYPGFPGTFGVFRQSQRSQ